MTTFAFWACLSHNNARDNAQYFGSRKRDSREKQKFIIVLLLFFFKLSTLISYRSGFIFSPRTKNTYFYILHFLLELCIVLKHIPTVSNVSAFHHNTNDVGVVRY